MWTTSFRFEKRPAMSKKPTSATMGSDLERLRGMRDEDIDTSDIPEITPEQFARAVVRVGLMPVESKKQVTLRLDSDVLSWFKAQGPGYQTRINELLREYMKAHKPK